MLTMVSAIPVDDVPTERICAALQPCRVHAVGISGVKSLGHNVVNLLYAINSLRMTHKTVIVGSYFRDLVFYADGFPVPGETRMSQFEQGHGGKGSNQALCAHTLGLKEVTFVSAVGGDTFGDEIRALYTARNLRNSFVLSEKPTGCAGIFVSTSSGENMI